MSAHTRNALRKCAACKATLGHCNCSRVLGWDLTDTADRAHVVYVMNAHHGLVSALHRLVTLRDKAEREQFIVADSDIEAITNWRDDWTAAYEQARAAIAKTDGH